MKKILNVLLSLFIFISLTHFGLCAELQNQNEFRFDTSDDKDNIYLNRTSLNTSLDLPFIKEKLFSSLFFEPRWDFHIDRWYRVELGIELGRFIYKWFYVGESLQYVWLDPGNDIPEAETRLVFEKPIRLLNLYQDKTKLRLFEEYTYDIEGGEATRNEAGLTLLYNPTKHSELGIGWRHVVRIHDFDSDQITTSMTFIF